MNERIEELAEQCYEDNSTQIDVYKFAELIIKECSDVILKWKKEPFPFDEDTAVSIIHEHFGIELPPKTIRVIKI
jgi:hypothetical protein